MKTWFNGYSRYDVAFAYAWYAELWRPVRAPIEERLHRMKVRLGPSARLETEDRGVKEVYGHIVMAHEGRLIAYERLRRRMGDRCKDEPWARWPGTANMGGGLDPVGRWFKKHGIEEAVACYAR